MIVTLQNIQPVTVVSYDVSFDNETWRVDFSIVNQEVVAKTVSFPSGKELQASGTNVEKWAKITHAAYNYHLKMKAAWATLISTNHTNFSV